MKEYYFADWSFAYRFRMFYAILCSCNRQYELQRLVIWARRKKLTPPLSLYENRLAVEEKRLFRYAITYPRLMSLARMVSLFRRILFPPPRFLPKGSAAGYKTGLLTANTGRPYSRGLRFT